MPKLRGTREDVEMSRLGDDVADIRSVADQKEMAIVGLDVVMICSSGAPSWLSKAFCMSDGRDCVV